MFNIRSNSDTTDEKVKPDGKTGKKDERTEEGNRRAESAGKWKNGSLGEKSIVRFVLKKDEGLDLTQKTHRKKKDWMKRRMKSKFGPLKPEPKPFSDPLIHLVGGSRL